MEVTHSDGHVSNLVVSQNQSTDMGLADESFLMYLMSTAIYQNPELAMIRENITNASDIHIKCEIFDKPIQIELSLEKGIVIRDFGCGIPHDKFNAIYGMYGASTKRDDSTVTGGFGIGCKSPLAYTNSFQVTNHHNGTKTINVISKESSDALTKPTITPILSIPSTESGVEVQIDLVSPNDITVMERYIRSVVWRGGIDATLNGELLPKLDTSSVRTKYTLVTNYPSYALFDGEPIFVKYGEIMYPLPVVQGESEQDVLYKQLVKKVSKAIPDKFRLILLAEPDSISIAPSRENLTLSSLTINTLIDLLQSFDVALPSDGVRDNILRGFNNIIAKQAPETIVSPHSFKKVLSKHHSRLLETASMSTTKREAKLNIARILAHSKIRSSGWMHSRDTIPNNKLLQRWIDDVGMYKGSGWGPNNCDVILNNMLKPAYKRITSQLGSAIARSMRHGKFGTISPIPLSGERLSNYRGDIQANGILQWYRKEIVLTHIISSGNSQGVVAVREHMFGKYKDRVERAEILSNLYLPFLRLPKNQAVVTAVRELLIKLGWDVIDITGVNHSQPSRKTSVAQTFGGFPLRSNSRMYPIEEIQHDLNLRFGPRSTTRVDNPEYSLKVSTNVWSHNAAYPIKSLFKYNPVREYALDWLLTNKPNKGVIVTSSSAAKDVPDFMEVFLDALVGKILSEKNGVKYFMTTVTCRLMSVMRQPFTGTSSWLLNHKEFVRKTFGLKFNDYKVSKELVEMLEVFHDSSVETNEFYDYIHLPSVRKLMDAIDSVDESSLSYDEQLAGDVYDFISHVFGSSIQSFVSNVIPLSGSQRLVKGLFTAYKERHE